MKPQIIFATLLFIALCGVSAFAQKASGPQIVRDADNPARQPFVKTVTNWSSINIGTVPEGKVLVLEFISGRAASAETGTGAVSLSTYYQGAPETINMFAPSYYTEHTSSNKTYITQAMKLYIPAGRTMYVQWQGDSTPVFYTMTLMGHYVDVQ